MKQETITITKLIATKGNILTNGEVYGREVFLAVGESIENWHEITEEEYIEIQKKELEELDNE
jgi:hypothetical protein